jgi:hypothetical protein
MLLAEVGDDEPVAQDLLEVQRAGRRAAGLVRQLLAFGRRQIVQPRQVNLNDVVTGARSDAWKADR